MKTLYPTDWIQGVFRSKTICIALLMLICMPYFVYSQAFNVKGKVTDPDTKQGMPGVSVVVEGTTTGTTTDVEGNYTLNTPLGSSVLIFSFVGYQPQRVPVEGRTEINITMVLTDKQLSEVVVVGYATQKKVNLTGSVASVSSKDIVQAPVSNIAQALTGRLPGMVMKNVSGQPGKADAVRFSIRGFGTPLIMIDGVPATNDQFVLLDPNDIENVSILKDAASAAVYGARAGNGVILVTTKRGGSSKPQFNYRASYGLQGFVRPPQYANSYQLSVMENIALLNENKPAKWTNEQIQKFKDGNDPAYPFTDWFGLLFAEQSPQNQHNLSVQGGNESVKYFVSGGYMYQQGQYRSGDMNFNRFNLRSNIDINLSKRLSMGLDLAMFSATTNDLTYEIGRGTNPGIFHALQRSQPYWPSEFPDKSYIPWSGYLNPIYMSQQEYVGYNKNRQTFADAKLKFNYKLPFGFEAKAVIDYNRTNTRIKDRRKDFDVYRYDFSSNVYTFRERSFYRDNRDGRSLFESSGEVNNFNQQYFLTWNKSFAKHNLSALGVYEVIANNTDNFSAWRQNYDFNIEYLFAGPDLNKDNQGTASEDGRKGYIGRINYDYDGKYLLELNARYDGSPRFPAESRWGFFPSASVGWRISEEKFFKDNVSFIDNMKLRASFGRLGFDNIGQFQYLSLYSISDRFIYDQNLERSIRNTVLNNPNITWEKMETRNLGFEAGLLNNRLNVEFDWFYRKRSDVLTTRQASQPSIVGANLPPVNFAEFDNRGFELQLNYRNNFNGLKYDIGANVTWTREKTLLVDQPNYVNEETRRRLEQNGQWTNRLWGYKTQGLFQTIEEIQSWADQDGRNNATVLPGDIKYTDLNGDGIIDPSDLTIIGRGNTPEIMFGTTLNLAWKGFDLSMLWQGATNFNYDLLQIQETFRPFYADSWSWDIWYKNAYIPENPWIPANLNGYYPRYRTDQTSRTLSNWNRVSDYWLADATYIRLKTLELGYTLPNSLTNKVGLRNCRLSFSGFNLLTFSKMDLLDPEIETDRNIVPFPGQYYPQTKIYNFGINVSF